jgi:hypothetical protein
MKLYGIYREPGRAAHARRKRHGLDAPWHPRPEPKRMAVIEAANPTEALEAFAKAEQVRSRQVEGWHVARVQSKRRTQVKLVVTLANGRNTHEATYVAWEKEER